MKNFGEIPSSEEELNILTVKKLGELNNSNVEFTDGLDGKPRRAKVSLEKENSEDDNSKPENGESIIRKVLEENNIVEIK
jgi:hypothetical protein